MLFGVFARGCGAERDRAVGFFGIGGAFCSGCWFCSSQEPDSFCEDGHDRSVDRQGGDVFDLLWEAARREWDEHELMHFVFEHGGGGGGGGF